MKKIKLFGAGAALFAALCLGGCHRAGDLASENHSIYIEENVFKTITSSDFGTKKLESPLFDRTKGSQNVTRLQVPVLAYDENSVSLVWEKPEKYDNVSDYNVYIDGKLDGTARKNYSENYVWADTFMKSFYEFYEKKSDFDTVKIDIHCYKAKNLEPNTKYEFKVVAVDENGNELGKPQKIMWRTADSPKILNIKDFGAVETEGFTTYDSEKNAIIEKNTKAIQAAIDACPKGGKVIVPENSEGKVFVCGALWLKSDMTFEVNGTLWASPNNDHFEIGFLMYPFYPDTRAWGILNATTSQENHPLENIRLTGNGRIYGNGWKFGSGKNVFGDGFSSNEKDSKSNVLSGDPADLEKFGLPRFMGASSNGSRFFDTILASDSVLKYLENTGHYTEEQISSMKTAETLEEADEVCKKVAEEVKAFSADMKNAYATRSSLVIFRNCKNVYVGNVTLENPSFHTLCVLESENISTENVKVKTYDCNNGDGFEYGCSTNVICWGNFLDAGDDSINFAASVGENARDCDISTNADLWIFNNFLREGHGGLAAGSHTGNGIQDILFEDCVMNHIDMAFRFKSAPTTGGFISNVTMRDCAVADTNQAWVYTTAYSDAGSPSTTEFAEIGSFYNMASYNISVFGVNHNAIQVLADCDPISNPHKPKHSHHNMYFQDITFADVGANGEFKNYNGWETLVGLENAVFYNFKTVSYHANALEAKTNLAFSNIQFCRNLIFQGTTLDSLGVNKEKLNGLMSKIDGVDSNILYEILPATKPEEGRKINFSWNRKEGQNEIYGIETYVNGKLVDSRDGFSGNYVQIDRLSSGVNYLFKIYGSLKGDSSPKIKISGNNRTLLAEVKVKVDGEKEGEIKLPSKTEFTLSNSVYTHAQGKWTNLSLEDKRIRGYKFFVNGKLSKTFMNYQFPKYASSKTFANQIGRLASDSENAVRIVAFTDSGLEFDFGEQKIRTLPNYDYKAPVWAFGSKVQVSLDSDGKSLILSWPSAKDETKVLGYRVYVDGKPYGGNSDFNPVNGAFTTDKTSFKVEGLDLSENHGFTVQAGDSWWKAEEKMGGYDKMASFNWTTFGIEGKWKGL